MRAVLVHGSRGMAAAPLGGCSPLTQRCGDARDYARELRPCCRAHVRRLMELTARLLTGIGATWWADYGTLLGAVRNPLTTWADYPWLPQEGRETPGPAAGIIPHDKDADLGVLWRDFEKARRALRTLAARGMNVVANPQRGSIKVRLSARNHTNVDLFFWHGRPDGSLYRTVYAPVDAHKGKEFPKSAIEQTTPVTYEGLTLPAPADPAAFLEMRYGPTWRTPVMANFDASYSGAPA